MKGTKGKQAYALQRHLGVDAAVAGRMIDAGLCTVKLARQASAAKLKAIPGISAGKADAIRGGKL